MANLELRLRTFIPQARILFSQIGNTYVYFKGDGRGPSWTGTHRTMQKFIIDTSKENYGLSASKNVGSTTREGYVGTTLTATETDTASSTGITHSYEVRSDDNLYITCKCAVANPLVVGAPDIDYEFVIKVTRAGSVRIAGQHDGFPAYELWRKFSNETNAKKVFSYDPITAGEDELALFPPMDKSADVGLSA